jgi:hypothetical protein
LIHNGHPKLPPYTPHILAEVLKLFHRDINAMPGTATPLAMKSESL